jgi:hypothetical protein
MANLDRQLQRVAVQLQRQVGPGVGADIVMVWRPGTALAPVAAGAGVSRFGVPLTTGVDPARPDLGLELVGTYYARLSPDDSGGPQDFGGKQADVLPWLATFNEGDSPDISGADILVRCIKRTTLQTVALTGWRSLTAYALGAREQPADAVVLAGCLMQFEVTVAGVSGDTEPDWPTTVGDTVTDGTITWTNRGQLQRFEVKDPGGIDTIPVERVVTCIEVTD